MTDIKDKRGNKIGEMGANLQETLWLKLKQNYENTLEGLKTELEELPDRIKMTKALVKFCKKEVKKVSKS